MKQKIIPASHIKLKVHEKKNRNYFKNNFSEYILMKSRKEKKKKVYFP